MPLKIIIISGFNLAIVLVKMKFEKVVKKVVFRSVFLTI